MHSSILRRLSIVTVAFIVGAALSSSIYASSPGVVGNGENQAFGITSDFGKHTGGNITWVYNSTNAPAGWTDDTATAAAFQAAIDEWAGVCNLTFTYNGVDDSADYTNSGDGVVVVSWDAGIGGAAGLAGPTSTNATLVTLGRWNYIDGSLRMNPTVFSFAGGTASEQVRNQRSFHGVAVHELGHVLGLGHSDKPDSIMYADPYNSITHVMNDDIVGCRDMYGYSDVYAGFETFTPPTAGTEPYDILFVSAESAPTVPVTTDDGTILATDRVFLRWQKTTGTFPETLTQVVVDPHGALYTAAEVNITIPASQAFGIARFSTLREIPGLWTVYAYDTSGLINTFTIDVTTSLPVVNEAPASTFSFSENPVTRAVSLNADVTGDNEGDLVTVTWHIPGQAPIAVPLNASSGSNAQNPTLTGGPDHEIFLEVNDDSTRYTGVNPGTGPAGPGFQTLYRYFSNERRSRVDMNGSGGADVLWRESTSGQTWRYEMNGNLVAASSPINIVADSDWSIVGTGDFNEDGNTDIVWRNTSNGQNWMYLMNGNTIERSEPINVVSNQNWRVVGTGDYDGDNSADLLWRNVSTGENWIYLMKGNAIATSERLNVVSNTNWSIVASADFNADGKDDILWRNSVTGANWVYLMNGTSITSSSLVNVVSNSEWQIVGTDDFDGNGTADILWRNSVNGQNWMYLMNGTMVSTSAAINVASNLDWRVAATGDYDNDGDADILWREATTGQNWMYLMDGATIDDSLFVNWVGNTDWNIVNEQ